MARLRTNVLKWGNKYDGPNDYKHCRRGAAPDAFWDEDELVDYVSTKKRKKKAKKKRGCPENNYKAHVYIWQHVIKRYIAWNGTLRSHEYDEYICCGCEHVFKRRYRW